MRVCFIHDYGRALWDEGCAQANGRWLYDLIGPGLRYLGHDVVLIDGDKPELQSLMDPREGTAADRTRRWSSQYSDPSSASDQACLLPLLGGATLVIGFEVTPNQMRMLDRSGYKVVDFAIDPIRFASDLFFALRTNDRQLAAALDEVSVPDQSLEMDPAFKPATPHHSGSEPAGDLPALFVGQTDTDAALVCGGRSVTIEPFLPYLRERFGSGAGLLLKPHPYGREHHDIRTLHLAFPAAKFISDNIYALLGGHRVREVVTLSSGVATEAGFFGLRATTLIRPDKDADPGADAALPRRVRLASLTPAFWRQAVGGKAAGDEAPPRRSLRDALGVVWGYEPGRPLTSRYVGCGDRLGFGKGQNGGKLLTFGWSASERQGTWSDGEVATILVDPAGEALDLHLHCQAFKADGRKKLEVRLQLRGGSAPDQNLRLRRGATRRLVVPIPAVREPVEVALYIDEPTSPASCGLSSDKRALGVSLSRACVVRRRTDATKWSFSALGATASSMVMTLFGL